MKSNKNHLIVGIGELLWDMFPEGKKAGGAPVNFVYHATSMGAEGYAISIILPFQRHKTSQIKKLQESYIYRKISIMCFRLFQF